MVNLPRQRCLQSSSGLGGTAEASSQKSDILAITPEAEGNLIVADAGLNKGEAHHALKRAISFKGRGEIRDRNSEGQRYRVSSMNLLGAIIIYGNTRRLGKIVAARSNHGDAPDPALLAHVSPLGWEHSNLTDEYRRRP